MVLVGPNRRFFPAISVALLLSIVFVFFLIQRVPWEELQHRRVAHPLKDQIVSEAILLDSEELSHEANKVTKATAIPLTVPSVSLPTSSAPSPIPTEYFMSPAPTAEWCNDRFELAYLTSLSRTQTEYCDTSVSTSTLRCFNTPTGKDGRVDSFCIGGPAIFDDRERKFQLDCRLREWDKEEAKSIPLQQFPLYWYHTGPRLLMNRYLELNGAPEHTYAVARGPKKFTIMVRREEAVDNLWHELMEISSMIWTLDVLRMSRDPMTGIPLFSPDDVKNTRVLIEDDYKEGPFFSLWSIFAQRPITRIGETVEVDSREPENIIFPLPGGSNPMWQGDWVAHSCDHSALLKVFAERVMDFYNIDRAKKQDDSPLVLTFIDRREKRRLVEKEDYVEELRRTYPKIQFEMADLAALNFAEQLQVVRNTDILVGVHGAGLTHALFLPPSSAVVEIIPAEFNHKGFRNLAHLLGHHYFSSHAILNGTKGSWQYDDVSFERERFMQLLGTAIASMYNRGSRSDDVV